MLFKPRKKSISKSIRNSRLTDEFLSTQKIFWSGRWVSEFIDGKRLIIHNAEFDISHLNNELKIIKNIIKNEIVDTLILARDKYPGSSISLDALCKRYRIDNSKRSKHTALIDCDLLSKVYINLIDQKEPTLDFKNQDLTKINTDNKKIDYFKKIIHPTAEELKLHSNYLKLNLKKNFLIKIFLYSSSKSTFFLL